MAEASADLAYLIRNQAGVEVICETLGCKHVHTLDLTALAGRFGDQVTLAQLQPRLKCSRCRRRDVRLEAFATGHGRIA